MDWLTHNVIADMYGPYFLLFYAVVIGFVIADCAHSMKKLDTSTGLSPLLVPQQPDPYEIAYLRGGTNEVVRLVIFDLLKSGLVTDAPPVVLTPSPTPFSAAYQRRMERGEPQSAPLEAVAARLDSTVKSISSQSRGQRKMLSAVPGSEADPRLTALHREMLSFFGTPKANAHEVFASPTTMAAAETFCRSYAAKAGSEQLLSPQETKPAIQRIRWIGILIIWALGLYKLAVALSNGHNNVGFLVLFAIVGSAILATSCKATRLTRRGRTYISRLQTAFSRLRRPSRTQPAGQTVDPALLLVGIFGFAALAGTEQAAYARIFQRSASTGGCGSGGDSGGDGCGSGGGGCGGGGDGGGCGGCGGGGD